MHIYTAMTFNVINMTCRIRTRYPASLCMNSSVLTDWLCYSMIYGLNHHQWNLLGPAQQQHQRSIVLISLNFIA